MRTTIRIDDELLRRARVTAADSGRSLGDVIDDALRAHFAQRDATTMPVTIPTYGSRGLRPGVDLEDKAALADLLDQPEERRAAG